MFATTHTCNPIAVINALKYTVQFFCVGTEGVLTRPSRFYYGAIMQRTAEKAMAKYTG